MLTAQTTMTPSPFCIEATASLDEARELMRSQHIRHLPVIARGRLLGLVTDRDLALVLSLPRLDPADVDIADVMRTAYVTAAPDTPLADVAAEMADGKHDVALVVHRGEVVGIVTTVDVCRALAHILRTERS